MSYVHHQRLTQRCTLCILICMSQLRTYLSENKISQRDFAQAIGVDQSVVSRLARQSIRPGLDLAFAIERTTKGAVPASSWIDAMPAPEAGAAKADPAQPTADAA
jgi:transcriptional regulator with XRE-family HTH domain